MVKLALGPMVSYCMVQASASPEKLQHNGLIVTNVSSAHFISHFHILTLPPLMPFISSALGIGITELAVLLSLFNLTTTVLQTPAGILTDRVDAAKLLIGALVLAGAAFALVPLMPHYWVMVIAFIAAGAANAIYHPADYAILSEKIAKRTLGRAFSIHSFSGFFGSAVAPITMVYIASQLGWEAGFWLSAVLAFAVALLLILCRSSLRCDHTTRKVETKADGTPAEVVSSRSLLTSPALLNNTLVWALLGLGGIGVQSYAALTWYELHKVSLDFANLALSAFLLTMAFGVLLGGVIATKTDRHNLVAGLSLGGTGVMLVISGLFAMPEAVLLIVAAIGGLCNGIALPSRDIIVKSSVPSGAYGRAFAIVSTGLSVGGIIAPLVFGVMLDKGYLTAACAGMGLAFLLTVVLMMMPQGKAATSHH